MASAFDNHDAKYLFLTFYYIFVYLSADSSCTNVSKVPQVIELEVISQRQHFITQYITDKYKLL